MSYSLYCYLHHKSGVGSLSQSVIWQKTCRYQYLLGITKSCTNLSHSYMYRCFANCHEFVVHFWYLHLQLLQHNHTDNDCHNTNHGDRLKDKLCKEMNTGSHQQTPGFCLTSCSCNNSWHPCDTSPLASCSRRHSTTYKHFLQTGIDLNTKGSDFCISRWHAVAPLPCIVCTCVLQFRIQLNILTLTKRQQLIPKLQEYIAYISIQQELTHIFK